MEHLPPRLSYRGRSQALMGILLHVVFSTKYRKQVLADAWRDDLFSYIGGIVKDHKSSLLKAGGIEDHVHLLLRIHPRISDPQLSANRWGR